MLVTSSPTFQRARSPEHKAERREAILSAAARLAARDGVRQVTLTDIAAAVGIHKSALLRYFETREQIFLELTGRAWTEWAAAMGNALRNIDTDIDTDAADATSAVLAHVFAARPLLCDLIPHTALNLERHVSTQGVRTYKLTSLGAVESVAVALGGPLPDLSIEDRRQLVSTTALLAGAMYQIATPPPSLAALYATDPQLGHALLDLEPRLARAAHVSICGMRALATGVSRQPGRVRTPPL
jgi:AcrR family transcriptional regulator